MTRDWLITAHITFIAIWPIALVFLAIVTAILLYIRYRLAVVLLAALFILTAIAGIWQIEHLQ